MNAEAREARIDLQIQEERQELVYERDLSLTSSMRMKERERDMLLKNVDVVARARALARLGLPAERAAGDETGEALARASRAVGRVCVRPEPYRAQLGPQMTHVPVNMATGTPALSALLWKEERLAVQAAVDHAIQEERQELMYERNLNLNYLMRMKEGERGVLLKNVDVVARARARLGVPE